MDMLNVERLPPREWGLLFAPQLGYRFAMHASAAGKAYLAALRPEDRSTLLRGQPLERVTPKTEIDPDVIEREIARVQVTGFGASDEEASPGSRAVSAAILDASGQPVAALLAQAATTDLSIDEMASAIAPRLVITSAQISTALGYDRAKVNDEWRRLGPRA